MKRITTIVVIIVFVCLLGGCKAPEVQIDYGKSDLYTQEDMDEAIGLIMKEISSWKGCELHSIAYSSDGENSEENVAWMNDLKEEGDTEKNFTECIMFKSSFRSPKKGGGAWIANREYTDWQWWLARTDGGEWKMMTWGY